MKKAAITGHRPRCRAVAWGRMESGMVLATAFLNTLKAEFIQSYAFMWLWMRRLNFRFSKLKINRVARAEFPPQVTSNGFWEICGQNPPCISAPRQILSPGHFTRAMFILQSLENGLLFLM